MKNRAVEPVQADEKLPAHEVVYRRLRSQILFGELAPGQAVTIQGLTEALGAGMTPVREAIRRLISDGALRFQGNRRVSVPSLSLLDLEQLIYARKTMESELAGRAAGRISEAGVDALVERDAVLDQSILSGDVKGYLTHNYLFHAQLYEAAEAPILEGIVDGLWMRFGPSLRVVCGRFGTQSLPDRHKDILQALRDGDAEGAAFATAQDVEQGMEQIAQVLSEENDSH
jgi:DNA-binding GntR family transcriptional regulator